MIFCETGLNGKYNYNIAACIFLLASGDITVVQLHATWHVIGYAIHTCTHTGTLHIRVEFHAGKILHIGTLSHAGTVSHTGTLHVQVHPSLTDTLSDTGTIFT